MEEVEREVKGERVGVEEGGGGERESDRLYIKNLDKKVDSEDMTQALLPLFNGDLRKIEEEVEIVIMKKGRMRGQGFMNFKSVHWATKVKEALDGVMVGTKPLLIEYSHQTKKTN